MKQRALKLIFFGLGGKPVYSCVNFKKYIGSGLCVFDDRFNDFLKISGDCDEWFIFGSPCALCRSGRRFDRFYGTCFLCGCPWRQKRILFKIGSHCCICPQSRIITCSICAAKFDIDRQRYSGMVPYRFSA